MRIQIAFRACLIFCIVLFLSAYAQERKIAKKDVPGPVTSAFQKSYPQAEIRGYAKEMEGGKIYYEIESMNGKMSLDALYFPDGSLAEVEEGISPADLSPLVKEGVSVKHAHATITRAEKTTLGDKITYELQLTAGKTKWSMEVDHTGRVLKDSMHRAKNNHSGSESRED